MECQNCESTFEKPTIINDEKVCPYCMSGDIVGDDDMNEVMIDLRKYDLADRLKLDMISCDALLRELEDALNTIEVLKEQIEEYENPNNYDSEEDFLDVWKRHKENGW